MWNFFGTRITRIIIRVNFTSRRNKFTPNITKNFIVTNYWNKIIIKNGKLCHTMLSYYHHFWKQIFCKSQMCPKKIINDPVLGDI